MAVVSSQVSVTDTPTVLFTASVQHHLNLQFLSSVSGQGVDLGGATVVRYSGYEFGPGSLVNVLALDLKAGDSLYAVADTGNTVIVMVLANPN